MMHAESKLRKTRSMSWVVVTSCCLLLVVGQCQASWIDPDTTKEAMTTKPLTDGDTREYQLVFSDEFEQDGRTFQDGNDPRWTALNKNDYTNAALHYYSDQNAVTSGGVLNLTTELKVNKYKAFDEDKKEYYMDEKHVQSAMLQGWNKFCITGGIIEFSAKLPGDALTGGLWPALWLLGNLARATYVGSSDFMWPFSYSGCNEHARDSQEINACSKVDHYGLEPGVGRGSPEIDVLEAMQGDPHDKLPSTHVKRPYLSCSYQVSPGIAENRPELGHKPKKGHWYSHLEYGNQTGAELNPFFYGVTLVHKPKAKTYQSDALSANMHLNETNYQSQHKYRVEWDPPEEDGTGGYIKWFVDNKLMYGVFGESLAITGSEIPSEPMYLLMNIAVSHTWGFPSPCPGGCKCECYECGNPDCACSLPDGYCENFPAHMEVDYVRVYQAVNESKHVLGCSTEKRPSETFIKGHADRYMAEGDKRPLEPVRRGGGSCSEDSDCGGGVCERGRCSCLEGTTGPTCLAHDGFYEHENKLWVAPLTLSSLYVPPGLIVIICALLVSFLLSYFGIIRKQKKEASYERLPTRPSSDGDSNTARSYNAAASYQNSGSTDYALPTTQKNVTYCVVDGRLIDQ